MASISEHDIEGQRRKYVTNRNIEIPPVLQYKTKRWEEDLQELGDQGPRGGSSSGETERNQNTEVTAWYAEKLGLHP